MGTVNDYGFKLVEYISDGVRLQKYLILDNLTDEIHPFLHDDVIDDTFAQIIKADTREAVNFDETDSYSCGYILGDSERGRVLMINPKNSQIMGQSLVKDYSYSLKSSIVNSRLYV